MPTDTPSAPPNARFEETVDELCRIICEVRKDGIHIAPGIKLFLMMAFKEGQVAAPLPPPQARTPPSVGMLKQLIACVRDFSGNCDCKNCNENTIPCDECAECLDFLEEEFRKVLLGKSPAGAESAPQEAGTIGHYPVPYRDHSDAWIQCSCGWGDFGTDGEEWLKHLASERGVPLEETKK